MTPCAIERDPYAIGPLRIHRRGFLIYQRQDVVDDGALGLGALVCFSAGEEEAGLVEGGEVEGVGAELDVGDDAAGLVDGEGKFHPTPVELGGALGCEGAPATVFPLGGGKVVVESANLWSFDYFRIIRIF